MKRLSIGLVCALGLVSMAHAKKAPPTAPVAAAAPQVNQEQLALLAAETSKCLLEKAPKKWEVAFAAVDRTDPAKPILYAQAKVKGKDETVSIIPCDVKKQANLVLSFAALIPAEQQGWKQLFYRVNPKGEYIVFTDIKASELKAQDEAKAVVDAAKAAANAVKEAAKK